MARRTFEFGESIKFYDQNPEDRWVYRFDVLSLRRDHRRILNRGPVIVSYLGIDIMVIDFDILCN